MAHRAFVERVSGLKDITPSERKLIRYMESHFASLAFQTIQSLSAQAQVGNATVSRLIGRLGYENYKAFVHAIRHEYIAAGDTPIARLTKKVNRATPLADALEQNMAEVEAGMSGLRPTLHSDEFAKAVDLLCDDSRMLYLMGTSAAEYILRYFKHFAGYFRDNMTTLTSDTPATVHKLVNLRKPSVFLALSFSRYSVLTANVVQFFHQAGHEVIFITDSVAAPSLPYCTVPLVVPSAGETMFKSRSGVLVLLEMLLASMEYRYTSVAADRYDAIEKMFQSFGYARFK